MTKLLCQPSEAQKKNANMSRFMEFVNRKHELQLTSYAEIHQWSTDRIPEFWASVWEFVEIICSKGYETVVDDLHKFPGA